MDKFLHKVRDTIKAYHMLPDRAKVLVGLSGGADSVALVLALRELGYTVWTCHLHHGLRGAEADRDQAFCAAFCKAQGLTMETRRVDAAQAARMGRESVETAARRLRYAFFRDLCPQGPVATAHTANDNLETMLFHIARGAGTAGLSGIPPVREGIVRPLIGCTRQEVEAFLQVRGQDFVQDSTNFSAEYTRNRIRMEAVPALTAVNSRAVEHAAALSARLRLDEDYLQRQAAQMLVRQGAGWQIGPLRQAHPALRARALRQLGEEYGAGALSARHVAALEALLENAIPSAQLDLPGGVCARREYNILVLERPSAPDSWARLEIPVPGCGTFGAEGLRVTIRRIENDQVFYKSFNTFWVRCDTIDLSTCVLRTRRTGDRVRLNARGGSKTLKKCMIEKKIPSARRDRLAVLADRLGIIAVQSVGVDIGRRIGDGAMFEIQFEG